ncbi:extracellular solute-binding protein [Candidatus Calescamantes bacterium]|nr:extracellular solute-binding protein [Candidatus Calescamantes bacterium]
MKRLFVLTCVLVIGFSVVVIGGCTSKEAKKENEGIVTSRWVLDPNPARKKQISLFEKVYSGIKVNLEWTSAGLEKILVQMAGGSPPDLIDIHSRINFNILMGKKVMVDITPYCENINLEDFWLQYLDEMEYARNIKMSSYVSDLEVRKIENLEYDRMWAEIQTSEVTLYNIAKKINDLITKNLQ